MCRLPAFRGHIGALVAYTVAALVLTWPLAQLFTTHVPGDGIDDPALAWNLWWIKFRLVDQAELGIFSGGWMFHPVDINLGFYTLTPLSGLVSVPLQLALSPLSPVVAVNQMLLSTFVLSGYGAWLLTRAVWREPLRRVSPWRAWWVAWLAGYVYAFAGAKMFYAALGQYNIAGSQWIPFAALAFWRVTQATTWTRAWRAGLLAGIFMTLQAWTELTYASFLILFAGLLWGWWLVARPRGSGAARVRMTAGFAVSTIVFGVGIAPFLAAMLPDMRAEGDFFASGGGFADVFSADLMGFLVPTRLHPWLGEWVATLPFANDKGQHIYLGYALTALIGLAVMGMWRRGGVTLRQGGFWLAALLAFGWLSLGPLLRWAGQDLPLPGPFELVSRLPFFSGNRYPSRYSVMLLLAASALVGYALAWLLRPTGRRGVWMAAVLAAVMVFEQLSVPLPVNDFRTPAVYARIAATPGDFAVLELPTGWRNGARVLGRSDVLIMMQQWYQTTHEKRRLGGNTSRNPPHKFQYFSEEPLLGDLIALMNADREHLAPVLAERYPSMVARAKADAPDLLAFLGVRYVTLHVERSPELLRRFVDEALPLTLVEEWQGQDWSGADSTIRLYEVVNAPTAQTVRVDLGDVPAASRYLAEGWSPVAQSGQGRYATRPRPRLLAALPEGGGTLRLTYTSSQRVAYRVNGGAWQEAAGMVHALAVDGDAMRGPVSAIEVRFLEDGVPVRHLATAPSPIGSTGTDLAPGVALVVRSAGEEVGDFAQLSVNGVDYAANTRGYNLVALSPHGNVLGTAVFDTLREGQGETLAAWVAQWPTGTVVAGAVADEASLNLDQAAVDALASLGVRTDLRGRFRWSHAFVGVVGASPGSALEAADVTRPVSLWLGLPADAPVVYGPLLAMEWSPATSE